MLPEGAFRFALHDDTASLFNVWATMFGDQALCLAASPRLGRSRARDGDPLGCEGRGFRRGRSRRPRRHRADLARCGVRVGRSGRASCPCSSRCRSRIGSRACGPPPRAGVRRPGSRVSPSSSPSATRLELLATALSSLYAALARVAEPHQVVVVVNGAAASVTPNSSSGIRGCRMDPPARRRSASAGRSNAASPAPASTRRSCSTTTCGSSRRRCLRVLLAIACARRIRDGRPQIFQRSASGRREETGFVDWYARSRGPAALTTLRCPGRRFAARASVPRAAAPLRCTRTQMLRRLFCPTARCLRPLSTGRMRNGVYARGARACARCFCPAAHAPPPCIRATHRAFLRAGRTRAHRRAQPLAVRCAPRRDVRRRVVAHGPCVRIALREPSATIAAAAAAIGGVFRQRLRARAERRPAAHTAIGWSAPRRSGRALPSATAYQLSRGVRTAPPRPPRSWYTTVRRVSHRATAAPPRVRAGARAFSPDFDIVLVTDEGRCTTRAASGLRASPRSVWCSARSLPGNRRPRSVPPAHALPPRPDQGGRDRRAGNSCDIVAVDVAEVRHSYRLWPPARAGLSTCASATARRTSPAPRTRGLRGLPARVRRAGAFAEQEDRPGRASAHRLPLPTGSRIAARAYAVGRGNHPTSSGPSGTRQDREGIIHFLNGPCAQSAAGVPAATLRVHDDDEPSAVHRDAAAFARAGVDVLGVRRALPDLLGASVPRSTRSSRIRGSAVNTRSSRWPPAACASAPAGGDSAAAAPAGLRDGARRRRRRWRNPSSRCFRRRHTLELPAGALDAFAWERSVARQKALYDALLRTRPRAPRRCPAYERLARTSTTSTWRATCRSTTSRSMRTCAPARADACSSWGAATAGSCWNCCRRESTRSASTPPLAVLRRAAPQGGRAGTGTPSGMDRGLFALRRRVGVILVRFWRSRHWDDPTSRGSSGGGARCLARAARSSSTRSYEGTRRPAGVPAGQPACRSAEFAARAFEAIRPAEPGNCSVGNLPGTEHGRRGHGPGGRRQTRFVAFGPIEGAQHWPLRHRARPGVVGLRRGLRDFGPRRSSRSPCGRQAGPRKIAVPARVAHSFVIGNPAIAASCRRRSTRRPARRRDRASAPACPSDPAAHHRHDDAQPASSGSAWAVFSPRTTRSPHHCAGRLHWLMVGIALMSVCRRTCSRPADLDPVWHEVSSYPRHRDRRAASPRNCCG